MQEKQTVRDRFRARSRDLIEKLFFDDLSVFHLIEGHFVHLHAAAAFEGAIKAHGAAEEIACHLGGAGLCTVDLLNRGFPGFSFSRGSGPFLSRT